MSNCFYLIESIIIFQNRQNLKDQNEKMDKFD